MREATLEGVHGIGPRAIEPLALIALASSRARAERLAAIDLLGTLDHPVAAGQLMDQAERSPEPWLRARCVAALEGTRHDRLVPRLLLRLLLRLRDEGDPATRTALASTLAAFHNYEAAAEEAWRSNRAGNLPQPQPSAALRLEVWRLVQAPSEHSQYALARLGPWAAREIAEALGDADAAIRAHVARTLAAMGPRATDAGPALLRALADPEIAILAAEALGRVGHPPAVPALLERTAREAPHELRVAATLALGRTGLPEASARIHALFADPSEPQELRRAAATALVLLDEGDVTVDFLLAAMDGDSDIALETWLVRGAKQGRAGFASVLRAWRAIEGPPGITLDAALEQELRAERAALLAGRVDALRGRD
ncbi:MAG: hypothetical protein GY711_04220 [bacterium]|nr:hypothetical protein [bacterium]